MISILKLSLQSTYIGFKLAHKIGFGTALQVKACNNTESLFLRLRDFKMAKKLDLPELKEKAYLTPKYFLKLSSNSFIAFPTCPEPPAEGFFHFQG